MSRSRGRVAPSIPLLERALRTRNTEVSNGDNIRRCVEAVDPEVLLVDFFYTLVTRRVPWWSVRLAFARQLGDLYDLDSSAYRINKYRAQAEHELGHRLKETGLDPEPRLDEVADEMWETMKPIFGDALPADRSEFSQTVIELDLAVERLAQLPDDDVIDAVKEAAAGRLVAIVSDFYMPEPHFSRMLDANGLGGLAEHVFVSCDARLSKKSGRLYSHVVERLESTHGPIELSRVLMIGDNPIADIDRAHQAGFASCHITRPLPSVASRAKARLTTPRAQRREVVRRALDTGGETPFVEMAVTLFVFIRLLHASAHDRGLESLAFQAREGQFLLTLFERYQELVPSAAVDPVEGHYLVVSRRSTALASMATLDDELFEGLLSRYEDLSIGGFLGSIGFDDELVTEIASDLGQTSSDLVDVDRLRGDAGFRAHYEHARSQQSDLLRRYVEQTVETERQRLDLVDVGWKGTIQDHLQRALGQSWDVHGHYLGVVAEPTMPNAERKHGVLFDSRRSDQAEYRQFRHFKALYEYVLQADHGSAARYRSTGAKVVPDLDAQDLEAAQFERHIRPLQRALLEAFSELCTMDGLGEQPLIDSLAEAGRYHTRMLYFPNRAEVDLLMSLRFYENYGEIGFNPDGQLSRRQKIAGIGDAIRDPRAFLQNGWPPFHLAALGLRPFIPVIGGARLVRERILPRAVRRARRLAEFVVRKR